MEHADDSSGEGPSECSQDTITVCPKTPRSILIAGDIDVCIPERECEDWDKEHRCENPVTPIADYCPEIING